MTTNALPSGSSMRQAISLITLGVSDYERATAFYAALGWSPALEIEQTAFFQANGVVLVLWSREKLAADSGIADDGSRWSGIMLAHNVTSRHEVDELIERARRSGATITREPAETFQQIADAEIAQRRAEIHRGQMALAKRLEIERLAGFRHQGELVLDLANVEIGVTPGEIRNVDLLRSAGFCNQLSKHSTKYDHNYE